MKEYTYEDAEKAFNEYFNAAGLDSRNYGINLKKNGVIGVSIKNADKRMAGIGEVGTEIYTKKINGLKANTAAVLFPRKGGGYIGFKNPNFKQTEALRLALKDINIFDDNLSLIEAKDKPKSVQQKTASAPKPLGASGQPAATSEPAPTAAEAHANPQSGGGQSTQSKTSVGTVGTTQSAPAEAQPAAPTTDGQSASTEKLTNLQKQFREKFPLKSESKPEPKKSIKAGFFSENAFKEHFNKKTFSLKRGYKDQLLGKRWRQTLDGVVGKNNMPTTNAQFKMAMEKFSEDYGLGVDLSNYKTSTLGRIANRIKGNKNISTSKALDLLSDAYTKKTYKYVNDLKEQYQSGKITDRQYIRRANRGWTRAAANGGERVPKSRNLEKLGWKGKGLAAVGLVALGGVISNMFSGGKKSNAELYNPNPQPQYYS